VNRIIKITLLLLGILAIFIIIATLRLPNDTYLWREIHNTGHTPLFGFLSLLILGLLFVFWEERVKHRLTFYIVAFIITIALGLGLEIYQIPGPGDADIFDFIRDVAGASSFLLFFMAIDHAYLTLRERNWKIRRILISVTALLILAAAFTPLVLWSAAYIERNHKFPVILNSEYILESKFISCRNAVFNSVPAPSAWTGKKGHVGKIKFGNGAYPSISLNEIYGDWRNFEMLKISIFSTRTDTININMRIDDTHYNQEIRDRFNRIIGVKPGINEIVIELNDVRKAPSSRQMDMSEIKKIMLFGSKAEAGDSIYIDDFRLE
jgi:hypothetical protein